MSSQARLGVAGVAVVFLLSAIGCSSSSSPSNADGEAEAGSTASDDTSPDCVASGSLEAGTTEHHARFDGVRRKYLLSIPDGYTGEEAAPLVVNLHGFTATAEAQILDSDMPDAAGARGYVVVTPEALPSRVGDTVGPLWNAAGAFTGTETDISEDETDLSTVSDVAFLNQLVDQLEEELCIDPAREYVTGMSNGAGMATWLICQPTSRFAAAAPVAGLTMGRVCPAETMPPLLTFHGDQDPAVSYDGGELAGFDLGIPAVEDRMAEFAVLQGCDPEPETIRIPPDVRHLVWSCPVGSAAEMYRIVGGGHVWPGSEVSPGATQTIDATEIILDFFDDHPSDG